MPTTEDQIRQTLVQYFQTDQLLGLKEVPIRLPQPRATAPHATGMAQTTRETQTAAEVGGKSERLRLLDEKQVKTCTKCALSQTRTNTVFGQGNPDARLVFVGEAPGFYEDRQGVVFVGRAGELLTRMIVAMGLTREQVYICNVLKCRPPNNRDPAPNEIAACSPYLFEQLSVIEPEVIVALGAPAAKTLLQTTQSIGRLRGQFHNFHCSGVEGVGPATPLMPTYHPAYLLRNQAQKAKVWSDLQAVMRQIGLPLPK
ncbi:MAG: uracil-DNA glycosylase [Phycisphaerae bacterium]|nr:uracil-DNA glycosylase [Phycisphaerae bacterium]